MSYPPSISALADYLNLASKSPPTPAPSISTLIKDIHKKVCEAPKLPVDQPYVALYLLERRLEVLDKFFVDGQLDEARYVDMTSEIMEAIYEYLRSRSTSVETTPTG